MMAAHALDQGSMLSALLQGLVDIPQNDDCLVTGLTLDSREVSEGTLFLACSGGSSHGLDFLDQAVKQGAVAIACELDAEWSQAEIERIRQELSIPIIVVIGLGRNASAIAGRFYGEPSKALSVIGVTGTNGKTSTTHYLAQALRLVHQLKNYQLDLQHRQLLLSLDLHSKDTVASMQRAL